MIRVDFHSDWGKFLETEMSVSGSPYDPSSSLEENTITYLNANRRIVPNRKRTVRESKELQIPPYHSADFLSLKKLMGDGGDLSPYLSRDIRKNRADKNDAMLNNWGFHHLHFSPSGARDVLFVRITETDIFVIQALPHGRHNPETWVDTELLRILHENWPDAAVGRVVGIHGESRMPTERIRLRSKNANFATTMPDGTVYVAPGGGVSSSGRCFLDVRDSAWTFRQLAFWQRAVEENETKLRSALDVPVAEELWLRMMKFGNDECLLYEQVRDKKIRLTAQQS